MWRSITRCATTKANRAATLQCVRLVGFGKPPRTGNVATGKGSQGTPKKPETVGGDRSEAHAQKFTFRPPPAPKQRRSIDLSIRDAPAAKEFSQLRDGTTKVDSGRRQAPPENRPEVPEHPSGSVASSHSSTEQEKNKGELPTVRIEAQDDTRTAAHGSTSLHNNHTEASASVLSHSSPQKLEQSRSSQPPPPPPQENSFKSPEPAKLPRSSHGILETPDGQSEASTVGMKRQTVEAQQQPQQQQQQQAKKKGSDESKREHHSGEDSFRQRLHRLFASWQQGVVASIGAAMGIAALVFFLYAPVRNDTVHQTVAVASEALSDAKLREHAILLSKDVVENILKDEKSLELVSGLVVQLLRQEDTRIAVSSFLRSLFEDHYTQEVTKKFVLTTVLDPWIQEQLQLVAKNLALDLLKNPSMKTALTSYLIASATDALRDTGLQEDAARAVRSAVGKSVNPWL